MRPGIVVRIRVNPRDCMTVADLAAKSDLTVEGMSFSSAVSLVLSALCEAARKMGAAPERDGFEYSEMMKLFSGTESKRKLDITHTITNAGSEFKVRAINMPLAPAIKRWSAEAHPEVTPAMRRANTHVVEMLAKKDAAPDSWTAKDEAELTWNIAVAAGDVTPEQPAE